MIKIDDLQTIINSVAFQKIWDEHVRGNSHFEDKSSPEMQSFMWTFASGWLAHRDAKATEIEQAEYQALLNTNAIVYGKPNQSEV